jgi:subtilase family serine protease
MHAQRFRVVSNLIAFTAVFVILASNICAAQPQELAGANAPDATRTQSLHGRVITPASSIAHAGDTGLRAHTHLQIFVPEEVVTPFAGPPFAGFGFETPASLACIYSLVPRQSLCNPNLVTANPTGGFGAIALVDAFHYPTALSDLQTFSAQFGLAAPNLSVVFATGTKPAQDPTGGWELEAALDIEWAHAMAPNARIFLVEARSDSFNDLLTAEAVASRLVASAGGGEVSNSWGGNEFAGETTLDSAFTTPGVVYFASSGDQPGLQYPAASPNVVAAGGTTTAHDPLTGNFLSERPWDLAGGGLSAFEARPSYQDSIQTIVGASRGVPDLSFDSNPVTGAWVFDSTPVQGAGSGWFILGGTSLAAPALAGIVNAAGSKLPSSHAELNLVYSNLAITTDFTDIRSGFCGPTAGFSAKLGWDPCTGVGSVKGKVGK